MMLTSKQEAPCYRRSTRPRFCIWQTAPPSSPPTSSRYRVLPMFLATTRTTGNLSRDRAEAVIDYLEKAGTVPVTHIVAPGVLGAQAPAATNEPAGGNPQNRRVEVKLLLPK